MQPVQAIFFDFDNTLVDDDASLRLALGRACEEIAPSLGDLAHEVLADTYFGISEAFWATQPWVGADIDELRLRLWREAFAAHGREDPALATMARDAYMLQRMHACEVYEDSLEVIERLSARYRLAIITNGGAATQQSRLRLAGMEHHFELLVASSEFDFGKPDPRIFHVALENMGLDPAGVWHVGDRLDADVLGAHNAGLTSVWLNRDGRARPSHHPEPHHEVATLHELLALLPDIQEEASLSRSP